MKKLEQEYHIMAPLSKVWDALVNPKTIDKWGGGPAKMSEVLGNFSLWGGDVKGKNTKVVKEKELDQDWMSGDWREFSKLKIRLTHKDSCTAVYLTQTGIPDSEFDDIADGWDRYYFGEIKKLLER